MDSIYLACAFASRAFPREHNAGDRDLPIVSSVPANFSLFLSLHYIIRDRAAFMFTYGGGVAAYERRIWSGGSHLQNNMCFL
jgi:hypothetical protein